MNKVINIQLAGQVFWVDEDAYEVLQSYLKKLKKQLSSEEDSEEIYKDIELRLAELFYELLSDTKQNISKENVEQVIDQIGYIELDDEPKSTNKNILDGHESIVGGVCLSLFRKTNVPVFVYRLLFMALILAGGFGIVLYIILWFSFRPKEKRDELLNSIKTSKAAESFNNGKSKVYIQKVIFFPFYVIGVVLKALGQFFYNFRGFFFSFFKILGTVLIFSILVSLSLGLYVMTDYRFLPTPYQGLFNLAGTFVIVSVAWYWINKMFFTKRRSLFTSELKTLLVFSIGCLITGGVYIAYSLSDWTEETTTQSYKLNSNTIILELDEIEKRLPGFDVRYQLNATYKTDSTVKVIVEYQSAGRDKSDALDNIENIEFTMDVKDSVFVMPTEYRLKEKAFYRNQSIRVILNIPEGMEVKTRSRVEKNYWFSQNRYRLVESRNSKMKTYVSENQHFYELNKQFMKKVSYNEKDELLRKISKVLLSRRGYSYMLESEHYDSSIQRYLKRDYHNSLSDIKDIRVLLRKNELIRLKDLEELQFRFRELDDEYNDMEPILEYMDGLLKVKRRGLN